MHNIKKIFGRLILIFLVLFLFETIVEFLYRPYNRYSIYAVRELKENQGQIDTLFLGTSTAYRGFSPEIIDECIESNSFNLATASQPTSGALALLKEQAGKNPIKRVFLGISPAVMKKGEPVIQAKAEVYDRLLSIRGKTSYLFDGCTSEDWIELLFYSARVDKYFDFETVRDNIAYKLSDAYKENQSPKETYKGRGYVAGTDVFVGTEYETLEKKESTWTVNPEKEKDLIEIMEYCKKEEIELILVYIPVTAEEMKRYGNQDVVHDYFQKLSSKYETEFWDFNYYVNLKEEFQNHVFQDERHLNETGSMHFSQLFSEVYNSYKHGEGIEDYFTDHCIYYE